MDLNIADLGIEVTRKCNMNCSHCLRGATQRKTISDHHIYKMLQLIDNVSTLTITGGEPTLAMDSLHQIRNCIIYGNANVENFYMVTNGKSINVDEVAEWAYHMHTCCGSDEMSHVAFSFDPYHTDTLNCKQMSKQQRNFENLKEKMEFEYGLCDDGCGDFITKHTTKERGYYPLITQGRSKDSGNYNNNMETFEDNGYEEDQDNVYFSESVLYLTCTGYIIAGCNWSYQEMDNNKKIQIGHIDDINCSDQLFEAIQAYNRKRNKASIDETELGIVYEQV